MKIGIFETEHFEAAYPVIRLFDMPSNQLVIFTTPASFSMLNQLLKEDMHRYEWVVAEQQPRRKFFRQLEHMVTAHRLQLFYINTISSNHILFARLIRRLPGVRVVLTVHDINCMFRSRWSWQPRKLVQHIGKKALIRQVQEFNVISDTMVHHLVQQTGVQKQVHQVPGAVFENRQANLTINDHIHLVVPGTIDKKRRDYDQVFALLQMAEKEALPVHITLLGAPVDEYGHEMMRRARAYQGACTRLLYYDTAIVQQDEFDKQLSSAHFLYIPSVVETAICSGIPATYGLTKSSGNIFDAVKHARPFIAPAHLTIPPALESSCYKINKLEQLGIFFRTLLSEKHAYEWWQQRALANSMEFTIGKVRERNPSLFFIAP